MANVNEIQQELLRLMRMQGSEPVDARMALTPPPLNAGAGTPLGDQPVAAESNDASPSAELARQLEALKRQLGAVEETSKRQTEQLERNTRAVADSVTAQSGRSAGAAAQDILANVRGAGGLGVLGSPLVGLFSRLFRRNNDEPAPALPSVSPTVPVREDLALPASGAGLTQVSYRGDGLPRAVPAPASGSGSSGPSGNVTIQVQTMDSRSFLDNSDQIARAVREAMLHSHALNDVIGEM